MRLELRFRRCYMLEFKRCVTAPAGCEAVELCVCRVCGHRQPWRRAGWRRTAHASARRSFRLGVDYFLLGTNRLRDGLIFRVISTRGGSQGVQLFSRILRVLVPETRKIFRPRRGGQSSRSRNRCLLHVGYASVRPKGEIDALPLDFRIRLASKKARFTMRDNSFRARDIA